MNTAVNVNVVHESEAQRQHARVRIPAKLRFLDAQRRTHEVKVDDLSAGGLSFHTKQQLSVGEVLRGRLQFVVDNLGQHAGAVCRDLLKAGFNAAKLSGGVSSWKADNLPLVK